MTKLKNREGYWRSKSEPNLPLPVAGEVAWKGKRRFLEALNKLEASEDTHHLAYKGWSTCRICECSNGSSSYSSGNWVWPSGFTHYVITHNVRPSLAFQEFILGERVV